MIKKIEANALTGVLVLLAKYYKNEGIISERDVDYYRICYKCLPTCIPNLYINSAINTLNNRIDFESLPEEKRFDKNVWSF